MRAMARSEAAPSLTLIPADEARRILAETPPVGRERVALGAALGRVLARGRSRRRPISRASAAPSWTATRCAAPTSRGASALSPVVLSRGRLGADGRRVPARGRRGRGGRDRDRRLASRGRRRRRHDRAHRVALRRRRARRDLARGRAGRQRRRARRGSRARRRRAARGPAPAAAGSGDAGDLRRSRPSTSTGARASPCCRPATSCAIRPRRPRPGQVRDANQTALGAQVDRRRLRRHATPASSPTTRAALRRRDRARCSPGTTP